MSERRCWLPWHHKWSLWSPYSEKAKRPDAPNGGFVFIDEREKRTCSSCGATQDRRIVLKDATRHGRTGW